VVTGGKTRTVRSHLHAVRRQLAREIGVPWNDREAKEVA
jgi:hypothetical protein